MDSPGGMLIPGWTICLNEAFVMKDSFDNDGIGGSFVSGNIDFPVVDYLSSFYDLVSVRLQEFNVVGI